jgi:hypothetical protein
MAKSVESKPKKSSDGARLCASHLSRRVLEGEARGTIRLTAANGVDMKFQHITGVLARRWLPFLALAAMLLPGAAVTAQMRGGFRARSRSARGFGSSFGSHRHAGNTRGYFLGDTAFFYDDYPFAPATPEQLGPQVIVIPTATPAPVAEAPPARPRSLLIELQGDRYVRLGGTDHPSIEATAHNAEVREVPARDARASNLPVEDLPVTVLVYRDGHREEASDYAIVGRTMYLHRADEKALGGGLSNIQISALDIPATIRVNRENGVSFVLPGPNEVVTRP